MNEEKVNKILSEKSDKELIEYAEKFNQEVHASSGKNGIRMSVPPMPEDSDMMIEELIRRYKEYSNFIFNRKIESK